LIDSATRREVLRQQVLCAIFKSVSPLHQYSGKARGKKLVKNTPLHGECRLADTRHYRRLLAGNSLMPLGYSLKGCHRPSADLQHSPKLPHAELRIFAFRFYEAAVRGLTRSANCCRSFLRQSCHSSDRFSLELATRPTRTTRPKLPVALAGMN